MNNPKHVILILGLFIILRGCGKNQMLKQILILGLFWWKFFFFFFLEEKIISIILLF